MSYGDIYSDYTDDVLLAADLALKLVTAIEEAISRNYGLEATVEQNKVLRTNMEADALHVRFKDSNISPTLYLDTAMEQYKLGISVEQIANDMAHAAVTAYRQSPVVPELTAEKAKKAVTLTLISAEKNEKLLQKVPHFIVGDLAAVPRWYITEDASFVVTNDMASKLNLTGDEVLQIGQQNINATKFEVVSMGDMLKDLFTGNDDDRAALEEMFPETSNPTMIVMTTRNRLQGARAILSKAALEEVQEKLHTKEFYILPSSIHETICIDANSGISTTYLREMVREINAVEVSAQDFLSDEVMKYDGNKISLVRDELKLDMPKVEETKIHHSGMHM